MSRKCPSPGLVEAAYIVGGLGGEGKGPLTGAGSYWSPEMLARHVGGSVGTHPGGVKETQDRWGEPIRRGGYSCRRSPWEPGLWENLQGPRMVQQCTVGAGREGGWDPSTTAWVLSDLQLKPRAGKEVA